MTSDVLQKQLLAPENVSLWFAGKQMKDDRPLSEHVGKNEKTKVVVKLQPKNQGAPVREPGLTEEQQAQMMLLSFRRQQELEVRRTTKIDLLLSFSACLQR